MSGATRASAQKIAAWLAADPSLQLRYAQAREFRRIARRTNNVDLTSRCNLFCEGCFYFEGGDYKRAREETDLRRWREFFRRQAEDGVTFVQIAGAEPALEQDRLAAAFDALPRGTVFTNGTIRIDPAIGYSILISIWGDEAATSELRGGGVFAKALTTYQGDPRARALFTVNARNVDQIPEVSHIIAAYGMKLCFNYFSPTESYLAKLNAHAPNDNSFFRISSADDNLTLTPEVLPRIRAAIDAAIDRHPQIVVHSHAFNRLMTQPKGIYEIDRDTGVAWNCNARNFRWHQAHRVDMRASEAKCGTPNVDCGSCRLYASAVGSLLFRQESFIGSIEEFRDWLDICEQYGRMHFLDTDSVWKAGHNVPFASPSAHTSGIYSSSSSPPTELTAAPTTSPVNSTVVETTDPATPTPALTRAQADNETAAMAANSSGKIRMAASSTEQQQTAKHRLQQAESACEVLSENFASIY